MGSIANDRTEHCIDGEAEWRYQMAGTGGIAVAVGDAVAIASTTTARATEAAALRRAAGSSRSGMDRDALMRRGWHGQARANEER